MFGALNFPALILELQDDLKQQREAANDGAHEADASDVHWRAHAHAMALIRIQDPLEFLDWAKRDRHWSYTLAEVMRDSSLRAPEVAARLMVAMLEQIEDELDSTQPEIDAAAITEAAVSARHAV